MKTPEEIKHGMECCKNIGSCIVGNCEYFSGYPICTRDLIRDALEYINELEARAPRWISVKERLPEEGVLVLTRDRYGNIRNRSLFVFSDETKAFRPDGLLPDKHITHWMPLPEAQEEGRHGRAD